MIYFITKDWPNTTSNHAGMQYLCRTMADLYPDRYRWLPVPESAYEVFEKKSNSFMQRVLHRIYRNSIRRRKGKMVCDALLPVFDNVLKKNDTVLLMEYLTPVVMLLPLAQAIRQRYDGVRIGGMAHLVPWKLKKNFSRKGIRSWIASVDIMLTLGSSLTEFLAGEYGENGRIHTLFHYVDDYYLNHEKSVPLNPGEKLRVIAMGNQMRDLDMLRETVRLTPEVHFVICQGMEDMSTLFPYSNVELIPFVEESELRRMMGSCHVSLNCMKDTIGSNVIVCSMAMGLGMICTDIGSIRDYCSDADTIFIPFGKKEGAVAASKALKRLATSPDIVNNMQKCARSRAKSFSIPLFAAALEKVLDSQE